jgi:hypothetical protein
MLSDSLYKYVNHEDFTGPSCGVLDDWLTESASAQDFTLRWFPAQAGLFFFFWLKKYRGSSSASI